MTPICHDGGVPVLQTDGPLLFKKTIFRIDFVSHTGGIEGGKKVSHRIQMFEAIILESRILFYIVIISISLGDRRGPTSARSRCEWGFEPFGALMTPANRKGRKGSCFV
ncbi:hypothetical protein TNIN_119341 [Trichonephila inaurata madagascariensis]|uniref:Uncharacterized protein n=1 Tax=Trichonephila inaurata madagascariensis TaxID=2747483 RepID=A0A8X7C189_9ARAC|nr:hypothetical protein TNIN_119341 [Trichonephila inaurata madagascariensis]